MPGIDVANLSSNWKKLQQTKSFKAPPSGPRNTKDDANTHNQGLKRKRPAQAPKHDPDRSAVHVVKRVKAPAYRGKSRMGQASTSVAAEPEPEPVMEKTQPPSGDALVNQGLHPTHKPGKYLALDCEMVGSGPPPASDNVLARVSIVNFHGEQVYDTYVLPVPGVQVTDYRTFVSGIRPQHLREGYARPFAQVQKEVADLLEGKILVGHALKNDLAVLLLPHPKRDIRDTARHAEFRKTSMGKSPSLRKLAKDLLGLDIQSGEHSSVEDARATMALFRLEKDAFEKEVKQRYGAAMKREQKKLVEMRKAKAKQASPDSDEEDGLDGQEEEEDEEEEDEDEFGNPKPKKSKRKNKKKKRTKRA